MKEDWRYVYTLYGELCVLILLVQMMLEWLVDNWDMKWIMDKVNYNYYNTDFQCVIAVNVYYLAHFGQGTGPIWLDNLHCTGIEQKHVTMSKRLRYW